MSKFKAGISSTKLFLSIVSNSTLRRLLFRNRKFWRAFGAHSPDGRKTIISEEASGSDYWSLIVSISAAVLAACFKAKVVFVIKGKSSPGQIFNIVQRTFCKCDFIYLGDYFDRNQARIKSTANELFKSVKTVTDILTIKYKDIPIGEQVYDSVLKHKYATIWRVDDKVLSQIENAVNCIDALHEVMRSHDVVAGIFTHSTGTYHGVAVRALLSKGYPVFLGFGGLDAMYRYNRVLGDTAQLDIHIKIPPTFFQQLLEKNRSKLLGDAELYFRQRFGGEINDWDALRAFAPDKKLYKDKAEFFRDYPRLKSERKTVFIMLHAMNDDPHVQRQHIFRDYYEWFATTLKLARSNKSVNWVFKQHPMIKFYPDDANLHGLFDLVSSDDHIEYIDETASFNSASIAVLADAVVTCAGTAGLEFAAFGIPAIIAAGNSYAGYGFCYEPKTAGEYANLVSSIDSLRPLDKVMSENAKILFYLIYKKLIPGYLTGFFPYLNHDEIKALDGPAAVRLYLQGLANHNTSKLEDLRSFILSGGRETEVELFMNI